MELKELILKHRRNFNVSTCLTGVIPFLAIRGNLELVDSAQLPDETKKRFVTVKENFERIREAMDKLVSLSKPASQIIYSN